MTHPLVEIRFEKTWFGNPDRHETVVVNWYHLPRVGEMVDTRQIGGKIISVVWHDECVQVFLKGENARD